jgi:hypothetical protein
MRWSQAQIESESPERIEAIAWLLHAERLAALPARLAARETRTAAGQLVLDLALYPRDG